MGTTSEELKKLYAKLGGKDPKVAGFSAPGEILNAINEIPLPTEYELPTVTTEDAGDVLVVNDEGKWDKGEASGGLPEVTTDDNGDILQVVEGVWAKAAQSKEVVVYELEPFGAGRKLKNDKHVSDILNDIQSGKYVYVKDTTSGMGMVADINRIADGQIDFTTATILTDNKTSYICRYSIITSPATTDVFGFKYLRYDTSNVLPGVNSSDNGNVLTVVNGAWAKAAASGGDIVVYKATQRNGSSVCDLDNGKTTQDIYNDIVAGKIVAIYVKNGLPKIFFYNEYHYTNKDFYVFSSTYIHDGKPYIATTELAVQEIPLPAMLITEHRLAFYSDIPTT